MKPGDVLALKKVDCLGCGAPHVAKRSDARCVSCHRERHRLKAAKFRAENPELAKAQLAEWRGLNQDKVKANKRKFQESMRAHRAFYQQTRRAEQMQRTPAWADRDAIKGMYELCGLFRRVGLDLHVDHVVPLKGKLVSGLHVSENLQLLHATQNLRKKNRMEIAWST